MEDNKGINVFSAFNGMGCIWLALDRAGIKVNKRFSSEIDKHAIAVNDKNYPDTIQLGDITKITKESFGGEKIDLVVGGSPRPLGLRKPRPTIGFGRMLIFLFPKRRCGRS